MLMSLVQSAYAQLPESEVTTTPKSPKGYYFMSSGRMMMMLDSAGKIVYYREVKPCLEFELLPNGQMVFDQDNFFYLMDSTFTEVDSVYAKNIFRTDGHGFEALPDGHFLMLGFDTTVAYVKKCAWNDSCKLDSTLIRGAVIQEQDRQGNVVFEWHAKDHYALNDADSFFVKCGPRVDWTHANGVIRDNDGNYLISIRNFNEVTKVSKTDGSIIWRFGGKHNQFKFINCKLPIYGQHDIERLPNGHLTMLDNGYHSKPHCARGLEFEIDEKNKIAKLVWSYIYDSTLTSLGRGNVQRINNTTTLVSFGTLSENKMCFVAVDASGQKIFQLDFKNGSNAYKVYNYPKLPWQLHRPQITCIDSGGISYLDAGAGYSGYQWNNDSTSQIIQVLKPGDFTVFVPYGDHGFISAETFTVSDVHGCKTSGGDNGKGLNQNNEAEPIKLFR
jgi:hypothetical protein